MEINESVWCGWGSTWGCMLLVSPLKPIPTSQSLWWWWWPIIIRWTTCTLNVKTFFKLGYLTRFRNIVSGRDCNGPHLSFAESSWVSNDYGTRFSRRVGWGRREGLLNVGWTSPWTVWIAYGRRHHVPLISQKHGICLVSRAFADFGKLGSSCNVITILLMLFWQKKGHWVGAMTE